MASNVTDIVKDVVAKYLQLPIAEVKLDMPIEEATDSLELSGLVVAVENRFRISLDDGAVGRLRVVGDLVTMVEQKLGSSGGE